MECPRLVPYGGGWAAVGKDYAVYAKSKQEAERRFVASQKLPDIKASIRRHPGKAFPDLAEELRVEEGEQEVICTCHHSEAAHRLLRSGACSFCFCHDFQASAITQPGQPITEEVRAPGEVAPSNF